MTSDGLSLATRARPRYIGDMVMRLEHRIGVAAPPAVVWSVIADFAGWEAWNPLHPQVDGELRIGAPLRLLQAAPGQPTETLAATVVDWVPEEQLVWATKYGGGLVRGSHFIEIDKLTEEGCIVSNGEIFSGLGVRFVGRSLRRNLRAGLVATGEALKLRAEALHREGAAVA